MPTWGWAAIAVFVAVIVILALVVAVSMVRYRRRQRLKEHFGPEYDRTVDAVGSRRAAEKDLVARQRKHQKLDIVELPEPSRDRYLEEWVATQASFVDDPSRAVAGADRLVTAVMRERGYPTDDFEQRAADVSVEHPQVVEHYRAAHVLLREQQNGDVDTEAQREALVHFRALFEELVGPVQRSDA